MQADGKVLVGGIFSAASGVSRNLIVLLSNNTAALSTLTVTTSTLTLTRDGSAPQFTRVIFERSTYNGATWTLLGTATNSLTSIVGNNKGENLLAPNAAGHMLSGQNIPNGQNVLIRAKGFYRSGFLNGSEITEDKVRQVFLAAPTAANVAVSGRVMNGSGAGLRNAIVHLTDATGTTRTARTSAFGYYRFDEVEAGQTYFFNISSKSYSFAPQIVTLIEDLNGLDFTAQ